MLHGKLHGTISVQLTFEASVAGGGDAGACISLACCMQRVPQDNVCNGIWAAASNSQKRRQAQQDITGRAVGKPCQVMGCRDSSSDRWNLRTACQGPLPAQGVWPQAVHWY